MGLAAAIGAAAAHVPGANAIRAIGIHDPYILHGPGLHCVATEFDPPAADRSTRFRVLCADPALPERLLFSGTFDYQPPRPPARPPDPASSQKGVTQAEIYQVFFHGPAFQVIAAARYHGHTLAARLAEAPLLVPDTVRLIEFAMQTAGLFELATTGRNRVPHRIGRIAPIPAEPPGPVPLQAVATRDHGSITVHVINATGAPVFTLTDYETVRLPFEIDLAPAARLTARLRATAG